MEHFCIVAFCIASAICQVYGASFMTSRLAEPLATTDPPLIDLISQVQENSDNRYTSKEKMLTAIKRMKFKSCLITDIDPFWNPTDEDVQSLIEKQTPETIKDDDDFLKLRKKAGDVIAYMCRKVYIYWFVSFVPPPLPSQNMNGNIPDNKQTPATMPDIPKELVPMPQNSKDAPKANTNDGGDNPGHGTRSKDINLNSNDGKDNLIHEPRSNNGKISLVANTGSNGLSGLSVIGNLLAPPAINSGENSLTEPLQSLNGDLLEPPVLPKEGLLEPPVLSNGNFLQPPVLPKGDLLEPPLLPKLDLREPPVLDLLEPPVLPKGDLLEPPALPNGDLLGPPALLNGDLLGPPALPSGDLLEPPILSNGELAPPPLINRNGEILADIKTPPPLAQILGLRTVVEKPAMKSDLPPPPPPRKAELVPSLIHAVKPDRKPNVEKSLTIAPPDPEFNTPGFRL